MFIYALFPLTVLLASRLGEINTWLAVATIAIACSAHQAWSANIFTTVSDMFPKRAVASVTGIGGMAGAIGGILIARVAGVLLAHYTALGRSKSVTASSSSSAVPLTSWPGWSCTCWPRAFKPVILS